MEQRNTSSVLYHMIKEYFIQISKPEFLVNKANPEYCFFLIKLIIEFFFLNFLHAYYIDLGFRLWNKKKVINSSKNSVPNSFGTGLDY